MDLPCKIVVCSRDLATAVDQTAALVRGKTEGIVDEIKLKVIKDDLPNEGVLKSVVDELDLLEKLEVSHRQTVEERLNKISHQLGY